MNQTPYRAIFFDLDGTLLPMELEEFMQRYMNSIGEFVAANGMDIELFRKGLGAGTKAMGIDDSEKSNAEVFWDAFFGIVPEDRCAWIPLFEDFYENHFGLIGKDINPTPYAAQSIETLKEKGYPLILATMPMFPIRAVEHRCSWAGVDPKVFERITNFENSTTVKPKLEYFAENLKAVNLQAEEVLMVGNNTLEDLACMKLGVDAYIVTDHLINPNDFDLSAVKHSSFEEFASWVKKLPLCENPATDISRGKIAK